MSGIERSPDLVTTLLDDLSDVNASTAVTPPSPFVAEIVDTRHPSIEARVLIAWSDPMGGRILRWVPVMRGLSLRVADRVLVEHPSNWPEVVVIGVIDGFARRPEVAPQPVAALTVRRDESITVVSEEGVPLLDVRRAESGPVLRLHSPDLAVEIDGHLRLSAKSIALRAREGEVCVDAASDVNVRGEIINLN